MSTLTKSSSLFIAVQFSPRLYIALKIYLNKPNYKRKMPDETTSSSRTIPIHCETDTELIPEFAMIELNGELISPGKRWIGETSIPTITS